MNHNLLTRSCISALAILFFSACGGTSEKEKTACLSGDPRPFFRKEDKGVSEHAFNVSGRQSTEHIRFDDGQVLDILQDGCDIFNQTFELTVAPEVDSWPKIRAVAVEQFSKYAQIDRRLFAFDQYAKILEAIPENFPVGAPANMAPGLTIRFFKLPTPVGNQWQIRYEQDLAAASGGN